MGRKVYLLISSKTHVQYKDVAHFYSINTEYIFYLKPGGLDIYRFIIAKESRYLFH